jgi:hypothetical protein
MTLRCSSAQVLSELVLEVNSLDKRYRGRLRVEHL